MVLKKTKQKHLCFSGSGHLRVGIFVFIFLFAALLSRGQTEGIQYTHIVRANPRPLQIHVVKVDLHEKNLEFHLEVADPPEEGEGTVVIANPYTLAGRGNFLAAINSNIFYLVDGTNNFVEGKPAYGLGWALSDGITRSAPAGCPNFWLDSEGEPCIGYVSPPEAAGAILGIEGLWDLMKEGTIMPGAGGTPEPRTALGFDKDKRYLTMVVVDGRMPLYSEGMTNRESALLMEELGCWNAIGLDGGGSSILLEQSNGGFVRKNRGVYGAVRPLPMLFGVKNIHKKTKPLSRPQLPN